MAANEPVEPRVRLAIAQWPEDAPRGAVTTFCAEHEISRKIFYVIRSRALADGQAAALEPRSWRPKACPTKLTDDIKQQALGVRPALESSGLDHGPISVHDKMRAMGLAPVPSIASLARIFREAGVARLEPKKRPRASWRRFVYPAPNACWQLDATEYVLTGGRKCVILQLIDDHSRYAVASHVLYNTERPHQGLPGRMTPQQAWDATPAAEAPRPSRERLTRPRVHRPAPQPVPRDLPEDTITKKLTSTGTLYLDTVQYMLGAIHGFKQVLIVTDGDQITVADLQGEVLAELTRPGPGVKYVGNGRRPGQRYPNPGTSPKS